MVTLAQRIWDEINEGWTLTSKQIAGRINSKLGSVCSVLTLMKGAGLVEVVEVVPKAGRWGKPQNRYRVTRGIGNEWKEVSKKFRDYSGQYCILHPVLKAKPKKGVDKLERLEESIKEDAERKHKPVEAEPKARIKAVVITPLLDFDLEAEMKSLMEKFIRVIGTTPRNVPMQKVKLAFNKALTYYG